MGKSLEEKLGLLVVVVPVRLAQVIILMGLVDLEAEAEGHMALMII
jgi:hypothetical protein